jgi:hypothetical protein
MNGDVTGYSNGSINYNAREVSVASTCQFTVHMEAIQNAAVTRLLLLQSYKMSVCAGLCINGYINRFTFI